MIGAILRDVRNAPRQVWRHPASYGVILVTLGVGLGAGTSMLAIANAVLFRPAFPGDPLSFTVAAAVLLVAAVAAILLPASRAARLDPTTALRQD